VLVIVVYMCQYINLGSPASSCKSDYSGPYIRKGSPPEGQSDLVKFTIVVFCSPSTSSTDSSHSVYFLADDSSSDIIRKQPLETMSLLTMENKQIASLEQALSELQAQDVTTQQKLDTLVNHITSLKPTEPIITPNPHPFSPKSMSSVHKPPPAVPSEFNRDHSNGMAFLCSCQTDICLCPDNFSDDQTKIVWALSYMKTGQAEKWAAQVF
jgi:hypothetical protein